MKWTTKQVDGTYRTFDDKEDSLLWELIMDIYNWWLKRKIEKENDKTN